MENKIKIGFSFNKIATEQFAIIEDNYKETDEVNLSTALNFGFNNDNQMVGVMTKFIFEQNAKPFLLIEISCHFEIDKGTLKSFSNPEKLTVTFPKNFLQHLCVIAIGAARGVLHAKTENTNFNKYILPTINVTEIVTSDVTFNVKKKKAKK